MLCCDSKIAEITCDRSFLAAAFTLPNRRIASPGRGSSRAPIPATPSLWTYSDLFARNAAASARAIMRRFSSESGKRGAGEVDL